jgi:hypothetical protein
MAILADHEGLYELSRMGPAVAVTVALVLASAAVTTFVAGRLGRGWFRAPAGQAAVLAVVAAVAAGILGVLPRDTASGYVVCGPVLHLGRSDSRLCDGVLDPLPLLVVVLVGVAVLAGVAALVLARASSPSSPVEPAEMPPH